MKTAIFRILVLLGLLVQGVDHVRADHHEKKDKPEKSKKAEDGKSEKEAADKESDKDGAKEEEAATSEHSIKIGGKKIDYTATAGSIQLKKENGKSRASVFYVAYEKKGVKDNASRPIMFCFNGGPGSSAVWLHLGAFGPRRVKLSKDGVTAPPPPFRLVDNQFSLIDVADLVFIDPVSTGYSRPEEGEDAKGFHGFQEDVDAVAEFIRLFVTKHERWDSPKFLAGESYGAIRASGLSEVLQSRYGMYLNGVVLVSGVLDFSTLFAHTSNDLPYIVFLPSMTAAAHYHKKLPEDLQQQDLKKTLRQVERFASTDYALALMKGGRLEGERRAGVLRQLSRFTGLDEEFIDRANLRVSPSRFRKELLREEGITVGRFDARMKGRDSEKAGDRPDYDPSYTIIYGAYASTLNAYLREELGYESELHYEILSRRVHPWNYKPFTNRYVSVADHIAEALNTNTALKYFVACGYHDLATPHYAIRYTMDHLQIDPSLRENLSVGFYDGGHMMYTSVASLKKLNADIRAFIEGAKGVE